ncbi:MAG TPA: enoyl-CoA hydratase-related protein [Bacillales bacterium]|nr:enoyl-CoA hydratase-related protein [Bacillales bacterium]HEU5138797.1 enoyl-CoA hydratase-related protein [Bacillales bacterium]
MPELIETRTDGPVGIVELNRPKVLNAINQQMVKEVVSELEGFDQNDDVRVIILQGAGRAFAAGADINEMAEVGAIEMELLDQFAVWDRIHLIKKPLICAVQGFAFGGGFEMALSCDMIFASEDAKFAFPEVKLGVMPGAGGTQMLTKAMGKRKAIEWLWLGDPMPVKEALHYGVINHSVAVEVLHDEVLRFARRLAKQPPLSLRMIKESVNKAVDHSLYEGMQFERKNFSILFSSKDQKEGMSAFLEKRKPDFKGE